MLGVWTELGKDEITFVITTPYFSCVTEPRVLGRNEDNEIR